MSVKITSKDGNVVITADDGSSVSGITVDGDEIVSKKRPWRCRCPECLSFDIVAPSLIITVIMTITFYYIMRC